MSPERKKPRIEKSEEGSPSLVDEDMPEDTLEEVIKKNSLPRDHKNFTLKTRVTDFTFIVEGKKVYVGSDFLSIHSSFFNALLNAKGFAESNKYEKVLKDVAYDHFIRLLVHLSNPTENNFNADEVQFLLALADRYDLKHLMDRIEHYFIITKDFSISEKFLVADRYRMIALQADCFDSIGLKDDQTKEEVENSEEFQELSDSAKRVFHAIADVSTFPINACQALSDVKYEILREVNNVEEPVDGFVAKGVLGGRSGADDRIRGHSIYIAGLLWSVELGGEVSVNKSPFLIVNRDQPTSVDWSVDGFVEMETVLYTDGGKIPNENGRRIKKYAFSLNNESRVGKMQDEENLEWEESYCTYFKIYITKVYGVRKDQRFDFTNPSEFSDTVMIVQNTKFYVNEQYLSTISSTFFNMFFPGENNHEKEEENGHKVVRLSNVNGKDFAELLNFIYPSAWSNVTDKKPIVLEKPVDVEELQKTLHESSAKLEEAARKVENAARKEFETAMENAVLKSEIEGLRRTIESVKKEQNEKLRQAEENRAKDLKIIEELRGQLGEMRRTLDGYHLINSDQIRTDTESLHEMNIPVGIDDSTNILVLCKSDDRATTFSFDSAVAQLSAKFNYDNNHWREKYYEAVREERSTCAVCPKKEFSRTQILGHFFSVKHGKKVRAAGAAVSLAAFDYWMHKLGSIPKPNPVLSVAASPVTALADGNIGGNDEVTKQDETIHDVGIDDSTNLFMMCTSRDPATISFNSAIDQLRAKFYYSNDEWRRRFLKVVKKERLACAACITVGIHGGAILEHFFSKKHVTKVRGFGAAVSIAAFEYWKRKLESIPNPIDNYCEATSATELEEGEIVD